MKRSIICYADQKKPYTIEVASAFARGCGGRVVIGFDKEEESDVTVVVGMGEGQKKIIARAKDWYEIDHGYIGRGTYYRVSHKSLWCDGRNEPDFKRLDVHRLSFRQDRALGRALLLALQSEGFYQRWAGTSRDGFIGRVRRETRSRRTLIVREKPLGKARKYRVPLRQHLNMSWAVIVHSSAVALDALMDGLPIVVMEPTYCAARLATPLKMLEHPRLPSVDERRDLFARIAAAQWTIEEMKSGEAWERTKVNGHG